MRREMERQARERARLAKEHEKVLRQQYLESQQNRAAAKTSAVDRQIANLDQVLTSVLPRSPLSFDQLKLTPQVPNFNPGTLARVEPSPEWSAFAPPDPGVVSRMLGGTTRHERRTAEAQDRFEAALSDHHEREVNRLQAYAAAKSEYERTAADIRTKAAAHNAEIEARRAAFGAGDAEAVEWFVRHVLDASRYPDGCPRQYQVAYRPENRDVVVELELPPQKVIPTEREYKYVKTRDAIDPVARPQNEIKQRYTRLIACVALRTLHEIFSATPGEVVDAVVFNGRVSTIDNATGKPARPHLLSVSTDRATFADLVLASVQP
ncbi:MAG: hypothetical protein WA432_05320, partial [Candidatus Babeliaceae bacterium]